MAELQTGYSDEQPTLYAGMVPNGETSGRASRSVADAGGIAFGRAVFAGAAGRSVTGTPGGVFLGFTIAHEAHSPLGGPDRYAQFEDAAFATRGTIAVQASVTVTGGQAVFIAPDGAITNDPDDETNVAAAGWQFDRDAAAGEIVMLAKRETNEA